MNIVLPRTLQTLLFNNLEAKYNPDYLEAKQNLYADNEKLLKYLGTYFPRSFVESYSIARSLFDNPVIKSAWAKKKSIRILDIGSGTGGNLVGFLSGMHRGSEKKTIDVVSVDGNSAALNLQRKVLEGCYNDELRFLPRVVTFSDLEIFRVQLEGLLQDDFRTFDAIITSKFISELYLRESFKPIVPRWNGDGYYHELFLWAEKYLDRDGVLIVSDVTIKVPNVGKYIPHILNTELIAYLQDGHSGGLRCILPRSCAVYASRCASPNACFNQKVQTVSHVFRDQDICKFTFRVLGQQELADSLQASACPEGSTYGIMQDKSQTYVNVCANGRCENADCYAGYELIDGFSLERGAL